MNVSFHRQFKKTYKKLRVPDRKKCDARLILFMENPHHPLLHNHELKGVHKGFCSINITGDIHALYKIKNKNTAVFIIVATHSKLY